MVVVGKRGRFSFFCWRRYGRGTRLAVVVLSGDLALALLDLAALLVRLGGGTSVIDLALAASCSWTEAGPAVSALGDHGDLGSLLNGEGRTSRQTSAWSFFSLARV